MLNFVNTSFFWLLAFLIIYLFAPICLQCHVNICHCLVIIIIIINKFNAHSKASCSALTVVFFTSWHAHYTHTLFNPFVKGSLRLQLTYHDPHQVIQIARCSLAVAIRFYRPSLLEGILDDTQCSHRADVGKFLLVGQHWRVHVSESIRERRRLWIHFNFSCTTPHVLFVLIGWFVRWNVDGCTAAIL